MLQDRIAPASGEPRLALRFAGTTTEIRVRLRASFISVEQACKNVDNEIPDETTLEQTAEKTRAEWAEKLDRIEVEGATEEQNVIFYTAVFHTLQVRTWLSPRVPQIY